MKKSFIILLVSLLCYLNLYSQTWQSCYNGLYGGNVKIFASFNNCIFAGTIAEGIYISIDSGFHWTPRNTGLTNLNIKAISVTDDKIFAGTDDGLFVSIDSGKTWDMVNNKFSHSAVYFMSSSGNNIFLEVACSDTSKYYFGLVLSTDDGVSWTNIKRIYDSANSNYLNITSLAAKGDSLYIGSNYLYLITVNNFKPKRIHSVIDGFVNSIFISDTNIVITAHGSGGGGYVFISTNSGKTWSDVQSPDDAPYLSTIIGSNIYMGSYYNGVFISTNLGNTWTSTNNNIIKTDITALYSFSNNLLVGSSTGGIFCSSNYGQYWINDRDLKNITINSLFLNDDKLFAGTSNGIFYSTDDGNNWDPVIYGYPVTYFVAKGDSIIFATSTNYSSNRIYYSYDFGKTIISNSQYDFIYNIKSFAMSRDTIYAAIDKGIAYSTNFGINWKTNTLKYEYNPLTIVLFNNYIFTNFDTNFWVSSNLGKVWSNYFIDSTDLIRKLVLNNSILYAGMINDGIYKSDNFGKNWTLINNGLRSFHIYDFAFKWNNIFSASDSGVFLSSNNGNNWYAINDGLTKLDINSLVIKNNTLFASIGSNGIYKLDLNYLDINDTPEIYSKQTIVCPNPVQDILTISNLPNDSDYNTTIEIYNIYGLKEIEVPYTDKIDVSKLNTGVYYLKINNQFVKFVKFIK